MSPPKDEALMSARMIAVMRYFPVLAALLSCGRASVPDAHARRTHASQFYLSHAAWENGIRSEADPTLRARTDTLPGVSPGLRIFRAMEGDPHAPWLLFAATPDGDIPLGGTPAPELPRVAAILGAVHSDSEAVTRAKRLTALLDRNGLGFCYFPNQSHYAADTLRLYTAIRDSLRRFRIPGDTLVRDGRGRLVRTALVTHDLRDTDGLYSTVVVTLLFEPGGTLADWYLRDVGSFRIDPALSPETPAGCPA